jgi:large subunit ribosomal protein L7A
MGVLCPLIARALDQEKKVYMVLEHLKNGKKVIGIKQTIKAVENDTALEVFVASDADEKVVGNLKEICLKRGVNIQFVESMKSLGKICGIEVGASSVCLLKE